MNPANLARIGITISLAACSARADQAPFVAVADVTDNSGLAPVTATSSNFINFTNSIIEATNQFQGFSGHPYTAISTFLGVPNAISYMTNAPGTSVTINLNPINFSQTFTGVSSSDVNTQVDNFFEKNGAGIWAQFLKAIARTSAIAVTDGNPTSATAIDAQGLFFGTAMTPSDTLVDQAEGGKPEFGGLAIGFDTGFFTAGDFKGDTFDLSLTALNLGLGSSVRLEMPLAFNYLTVDGARVGGAGINLVLPIQFSTMGADTPFNWRVTPVAGVSARASEDLASGVALWDFGVISTVDYKVNSRLVLCLMDQISAYKSFTVSYGSYSFDPDVNQQILKNGVRLVTPITERVIFDFFLIETNFLQAAVTKEFTTFGTSFSLRASRHYNLSLAANYDTGPSFSSWGIGLNSAWRW
jgi:hypothetical protein